MKCGYKGCNCEMKLDITKMDYPRGYYCPKCYTTAIVYKSGLCERYDTDGKLYTFDIGDEKQ